MQTQKHPLAGPGERRITWVEQESTSDGLGGAVALYLRYHRAERHAERTVETYEQRLRRFVAWMGGAATPVAAVTSRALLGYLGSLQEAGLAEATVGSHWGHARAFVRWLWRWEYLADDPSRRIRPPKIHRRPKGFLGGDGLRRLLDQAASDGGFLGARRQAMIWMLLTSGLRLQEFAALELADLDWEGGRIAVREAKGGMFRHALFHQEAQRAVLKYLRFRRGDREPALWTGRSGPLKASGIYQDMAALERLAGVRVKDALHVFRRTFAAQGVAQGTPREYVQAGGGWKTPAMLDAYVADLKGQETEALRALQAVHWMKR